MTLKLKILQKHFKTVYNVNVDLLHKREFEGVTIMMKMTSKVLASSLVMLTALGLAGCTNSAQAPTSKTTTTAAKVSKQAPTKEKATASNHQQAVKPQAATTSSQYSTTNSNDQAAVATSSQTTSSVSQRAQAQSSSIANSQNDQAVLTSFVKTSGVQQDGNHYYVQKDNNSNNYQIEIRNNQNGDPNIAHLTGTYQYDPTTNQLHEMNPITGNYDN